MNIKGSHIDLTNKAVFVSARSITPSELVALIRNKLQTHVASQVVRFVRKPIRKLHVHSDSMVGRPDKWRVGTPSPPSGPECRMVEEFTYAATLVTSIILIILIIIYIYIYYDINYLTCFC